MRIYLDTAIVIYLIEWVAFYATAVDARLKAPGIVRVASDLTRMECRAKPLRDGDLDLIKDYDDFFDQAVAEIIRLSPQVIDSATEIRAQHRFRTPDSIHLAAAVVSGCDVFLTNDHRLNRFGEMTVEIIQP